MKWNPMRIACLAGAGIAAAVAFLFPPAAVIATPIATGLAGIATRTPGHEPKQ